MTPLRPVRFLWIAMLLWAPAHVAGTSLIVNDDFESGNSGFTTDYTYSPGNLMSTETYDIVTDPHDSHNLAMSYGDHTSGSGLMMAVNASTNADQVVWSQTVVVAAGQEYLFSMWVSSWSDYPPAASLSVTVNGTQIGSSFLAPDPTTEAGQWESFSASWDSGGNTSADLAIVDEDTTGVGNDFALDDLSFVHVPGPPTIGLSNPLHDTIITGGTGSLGATVSNTAAAGAQDLSYTLSAAVSTGSATLDPVTPGAGSLAPGVGEANTVPAASTNIGSNTVTFTATDMNATNSPETIDATLTVLDHSDGAFANLAGAGSGQITDGGKTLTIDFGCVDEGTGGGHLDSFFDIFAEVTTAGFTAPMDLDLLSGTGDTSRLFRESGPASFSDLPAGNAETYTFRFDTTSSGIFAATYTFSLSDQDLPGAAAETLTLNLGGEVVAIPEPGAAAIILLGLLGVIRRRPPLPGA